MNKIFLNIYFLLMLAICSLVACSGDSPSGKDDPKEEETEGSIKGPNIFIGGQDGYHTFRIPAIVKTANGTLLAFCEGRKNSGSDTGDIDLILRRSQDSGKTWSKIITVWDDGYNTCGNPSPVVDPQTGRIHLLMTWNLGSDGKSAGDFNVEGKTKDTRRVFYAYSDDEGLTWTKPQEITSQAKEQGYGWYATGPCHAIILTKNPHAGRIVIPCDAVKIGGGGHSHVIYSDDKGTTWKVGGKVSGGNESSVAELEDGRIIISCRNSSGKRILAWSSDGGESFGSPVKADDLPDPRCQGSILSTVFNGSNILLHSNCADASSRIKMTIKSSSNDGEAWNAGNLVWGGPSAYSDITMIDNNIVGILYENGDDRPYERISFNRFAISYIIK